MARQRSEQAHTKVLEAALTLFADRGIAATSMDAISAESGVSKATIYKHWSDKDQLVLEVLSYLHGLDREPPEFHTSDLRADLIAQLSYERNEDRAALKQRIMPHMVAYSTTNEVFGEAWRNLVVGRRRQELYKLIQRGIDKRELDPTLDFELAFALLFGPLAYRYVFVDGKKGRPPMPFLEGVVDAFLKVFAVDGTSAKPTPKRSRRSIQ